MTFLLAMAVVGCKSDVGWQGATGVGNPGSTKQQLARSSMPFTAATVSTDRFFVERCGADDVSVDLGVVVDLLDDTPVEVPGGEWCVFTVEWSGPIEIDGVGELGEPGHGTFHLELDVPSVQLVLQPLFLLDEDDLIFELGYPGWVSKDDIGLEDGHDIQVAPGDRRHDELVEQIELGSGLYVDVDGDGTLSDAEREAGPLFAGPLHDPQPVGTDE